MLSDDDDLLDGREVALDRVEHGRELLADDEDLRLRVIDDVRDLGRREAPVHRDVDGVHLRGTDEHVEVLGAVLVEERDSLLRVDALGDQRVRDPVRAPVEPAVGVGALGRRL